MYSRMDQVKLVEGSLLKNFTWSSLEYLDSFTPRPPPRTDLFYFTVFFHIQVFILVAPTVNLVVSHKKHFIYTMMQITVYKSMEIAVWTWVHIAVETNLFYSIV